MNELLTKRIEKLRAKLNKLIELYGTQDEKVLKCSQRLDMLISSVYKKGR